MKIKNIHQLALVVLALFFITCKKSETTNPTPSTENPTSTERSQAVKDYNELYLGSSVNSFTWNGNANNCAEGTLTQEILDKVFMRIKYFRKVVGVSNTGITMEADLNAKCQKHALMTTANNNKLSHYPDSTWKCYSADGALAARYGNIAYGAPNVENINLWVEDAGSNNMPVLHRRWILYSMASKFGFGCTQNAATLWVINNGSSFSLPANTPEFIAWPAKGFVPRQVVYPRWSFAIPYGSYPFKVDFTNATVTLVNASGVNVPLTVIHRDAVSSSYAGDNTLVWEPSGINLTLTTDQKYTVNINGVLVNGTSKNYSYDVTIINP